MKKKDWYSIISFIPHVCGKHGTKGDSASTLSVPATGSRAKVHHGHRMWARPDLTEQSQEIGSWMLRKASILCHSSQRIGVTSTNDVAKIHFDEFESTHTP